jgi:selenoprotein W-related protein
LAAELKRAFPDRVRDVRLIKGSGGVFEVRSGEQLLFSKRDLGRFPEPGEVEQKLSASTSDA